MKSQNTSWASEPNSPRLENITAHCANSEPSPSYQKAAQDTLALHNINFKLTRQLGISHELIEGGETFQRIWNEYREVERSAGQ